jgi:endonuclease III
MKDPLHLVLYENIGYLVDDQKRDKAFKELKKVIGLRPTDILAAADEDLIKVTKLGGIHPELRASRLKEIASIVLNDFEGDLTKVLDWPLPKAVKALKKFPSIGTPGAEKILLFTGAYPLLALESNGVRVMLRLGFGEEKSSYSASYSSVQTVTKDQLGENCNFLINAHLLLRRLGKDLCKTSNPACELCPLSLDCRYFNSQIKGASETRGSKNAGAFRKKM